MSTAVEVAVLGPLEIRVDGEPVSVGERTRALLAALALRPGSPAAPDRLVELVWPDGTPDGARNALQALVSRTRRALGEAGQVLVTGPLGYALDVPPQALDARRLEAAVAQARSVAATAVDVDELARVVACWRGDPFVEVADDPEAVAASARLHELRSEAAELHAEAMLARGGGAGIAADLRLLAAEYPTRERVHRALAVALYLAGRQTDALAVIDELIARLGDELGLDPDPRTGALRTALLRHDLAAASRAVGVPVADTGGTAPSGEPGRAAAPEGPRGGPRPVPRPRTSFVGRDEERGELVSLLGDARLVTLVGPGGTGKTRLAIEVVERLDPSPRDGVAFVDLAPLTDPSDVLPELATSIGMGSVEPSARGAGTLPPDRSLDDRVRDRLRHAELVLLVDNCEHMVEAAAQAVELALDAGPDVRVVATSREGLRVDGERLWPVPPLTVASDGSADGDPPRRWTADELLTFDAPRLFVERVRAADPSFELDATTTSAVAELCRRLDGLPLGIELAAARVGKLPVTALAGRLHDRFRLLTAGRRGVRRQETLEAVVAWSYDLLDDDQQRVFRGLGVFSGTVSLELVEAVLGDRAAPDDLLATLTELAERSLVMFTDPGEGGEDGVGGSPAPRVTLLETIRAYAEERLVEAGEAGALRDRHGALMAERAARAAVELRGPDQVRWYGLLDEEIDEYRAATAWLLEADPVAAVRISSDLAWYAWLRDRHDEAARWLGRALTAAGDRMPAELEAMARAWLGFLRSFGHDLDAAREQADAAAEALQRADDAALPFTRVAVRLLVAYVRAFGVPDPWTVVPAIEEAVALAEELDERWVVAAGRYALGVIVNAAGDRQRARREHELGLAAARSGGGLWAEFQHRQQLALELVIDGDYATAAEHVELAIPLGEAIGAHEQVRGARIHRSAIAIHVGEFDLARRIIGEVLGPAGVDRASGVAGGYAVGTLAHLLRREGDVPAALAAARRAEEIYLEVGERGGAIVAAVEVVHDSVALGDLPAARAAFDRAVGYTTDLPPVLLGTAPAYLLETEAAILLAEAGPAGAVAVAERVGRAARLRADLERPLVGSERYDVDRLEAELTAVLGRDAARDALAAGRDRTGLLPPLD